MNRLARLDFKPRKVAYISMHSSKPQEPLPEGVVVTRVVVPTPGISWFQKLNEIIAAIGFDGLCQALHVHENTVWHWLAHRREPNEMRQAKIDTLWKQFAKSKE